MHEFKCPGILPETWEKQQEQDRDDEVMAGYNVWACEAELFRLAPGVRRELLRSLWRNELASLDRLVERRQVIAEDDPRSIFAHHSRGIVDGVIHTLRTLGLVEKGGSGQRELESE